ncbi:kinase-like domain-containing protein [Lobosporangium transversale]|uniref:Kinase-like domain-containing protein n=1 Tax=Lobosporangium transversale TaxID=64571 RepID=A0A1Y2GQK8_9FUNG|nr:kinase-like domain-containing protein [Lobosporangium transversale]ORZ17535.1 kinase-like domain-containing protein [Lobosporangium transversale]|eukprot:XP_021881922.1 kinase-like domain-containing protein [Lobosporangium transversale]
MISFRPLYLFRTHNVREMDRKMTDLSIELYATFHLPLLQIALSSTPLSPEMPKFTRLYITKNRSLLHHCRDEPYAKIAILVDYHAGKPFIADAQTTPIGVIKPGSRVVQIKARVIIAKPIGDRHEMVTVGDLDCPSAWIMIACVKIVDIDVNVPAKFERGTLSKLRHEIFALSGSARLTPEEESAFSAALGIAPPNVVEHKLEESIADTESLSQSTAVSSPTVLAPASSSSSSSYDQQSAQAAKAPTKTIDTILPEISLSSFRHAPLALDKESAAKTDPTHQESSEKSPPPPIPTSPSMPLSHVNVPLSSVQAPTQTMSLPSKDKLAPKRLELNPETNLHESELSSEQISLRALSTREMQLLRDLKVVSQEKDVPYVSWNSIEPSLTVDSAHGLFKRIYHVQGDDSLVVQNFKEMDAESFEQRVREVACLLKLRGLEGVGQIQSIIDDEREQLVGLSMTKYAYTLKTYATSARNPPSAEQKLCVIRDMVAALASIHSAGLAHRDLSEVNIMIDEDPVAKLADETPRPLVRVIDFGKSVFVEREEVIKWSMKEAVPEEELDLLPLVVVPPDHGYKLYRSILTLPRSKFDHGPLPPVDPQLEDVYSMGVLIWRVFSGQSPWSGVIEDDLTKIRYFVGTDKQIRFQLQREVIGEMSRELLLKCLTADPATRWSAQQLNEWLQRPEVLKKLLEEFKASGGGRKKRSTRKD